MKLGYRMMVCVALAFTAVGGATGCAVDAAGGDEEDATASTGRFEIFVGQDGQYYFHLLAGNGEKLLQSEGYTSQAGAENGVDSLRVNATDPNQFKVLEAVNGEFYFNVVAKNGEIIGHGETYVTKSNAERGAATVQKVVKKSNRALAAKGGATFKTFRGLDGQYYFNLTAGNGEIMLQSEGYTSKQSALKGIESVRKNGAVATSYEINPASNGEYFFDVKAGNHEIIGHGETYKTHAGAEKAVGTLVGLLKTDMVADAK